MKIITLSLIAFLVSGNLFAQTTKITREDLELGLKEKCSVLKSDNDIKQGPYALYPLHSGRLLRDGFYKNNQKDSIWNSYDFDGAIQVRYDYTHKKLLFNKENEHSGNNPDHKYFVINGTDTSKMTLDQSPVYLDGNGKIQAIMASKTRYPSIAMEKNIQGKVIIAFTIDTAGNTSNYHIKKSIGGGCDEEALRIIKMIKGEWLPGMINGKPVTVEYEMPMSFTLSIGG